MQADNVEDAISEIAIRKFRRSRLFGKVAAQTGVSRRDARPRVDTAVTAIRGSSASTGAIGRFRQNRTLIGADRNGAFWSEAAARLCCLMASIDLAESYGSLHDHLMIDDDAPLVHGLSDLEYYLEMVASEGVRAATPDEVSARTGDVSAGVILCGHTHIARTVRLQSGCLIVNPGSVGLPAYDDDRPVPHKMEAGSPVARFRS